MLKQKMLQNDLSILVENIANPEPEILNPEIIPKAVGNPNELPKFYSLPLIDITYKLLENPTNDNQSKYETIRPQSKKINNYLITSDYQTTSSSSTTLKLNQTYFTKPNMTYFNEARSQPVYQQMQRSAENPMNTFYAGKRLQNNYINHS